MNISYLTTKKSNSFLFLIIAITSFGQFSIAQNNLTDSAILIDAVKKNNTGFVRLLIDTEIDLNVDLQEFQRSPLMWAAVRGNMDIVRLLVESGRADVNLSNPENNETALKYAIRGGNRDIVAYLVEVGEADLRDQEREILIYAIKLGNVDMNIIEYLASRVDVDEEDEFGSSALMHAALYGDIDIVRFLVEEAGANMYLRDIERTSAIIYAVEGGHTNIADYLIETGTEGFVGFVCRRISYSLCDQLIN